MTDKQKLISISGTLAIANDADLLEIARRAIEDELVYRRDNHISVLRNNGCAIRSKNGTGSGSDIFRLGHEEAMCIGLKAIAKYLQAGGEQPTARPMSITMLSDTNPEE